MTDKPIIFSAQMIRALLDGRKTQTRRILKPQPPEWVSKMTHEGRYGWIGSGGGHGTLMRLPYATGDRLWVRETCATWGGIANDAAYRATMGDDHWQDLLHDANNGAPWLLRPSIHMPRWASRLTLIVTDVRVQRLQDISEDDAKAEGAKPWTGAQQSYVTDFASIWREIYGPDAWDANPWVCALTFTVHRCNIDHMEAAE